MKDVRYFTVCSLFLLTIRLQAVPVLVSSDSAIYEEALTGMETVIQSETEVYYIDILETQAGGVPQFFQEIRRQSHPVVIAFGLRASRLVREYVPETQLLFSMVSSPKTLDLASGRICGVSMDLPVSDFFEILKEINPRSKQVVALHSATGAESALEGAYHDLKYGLLYMPVKVENPLQFESKLRESAVGTDAILMTPDPLYTRENFEILSRYSSENRKILMTGFTSLLQIGATFALTPDYARIGMQTGEIYNRLMTGESDCSKELVKHPEEQALYINEDYAKLQGIELPPQIITRAKNTRLFSAGVNLLKEEKLNAAKKIFEMILEHDPENKSALLYLEIIIEKQTGNKTRILLSEGDEYLNQKKYSLARLKYAEVLKMNPKNEAAKQGINRAITELSEEYRREGYNRAQSGRNFDAIRSYLEALKVLPGNQKAKTELQSLRNQESKKIPGYLSEGEDAYNVREYEKAITNFENILLVDPANKQALEYLRLSRQKKDAAEKLLRKQRSSK